MTFKDIVLQMNSYPEPTPRWALESARNLGIKFGAKVSAGLCQVHIPLVSNWLANQLTHADEVIEAENRRSADSAAALMAQFLSIVGAEQTGDHFVIHCPRMVTPWELASRCRVHDLTIVPAYGHPETGAMVEGLVFETGRPVLLLPPVGPVGSKCEHVVIGWDGSRAAARAVADSLPICSLAISVTIATVTGEKELAKTAEPAGVVRHLLRHGIASQSIEVPSEGRDAGSALQAYCQSTGSDLLAIGAFGHSRMREFVLGGATRTILHDPKVPVQLSH